MGVGHWFALRVRLLGDRWHRQREGPEFDDTPNRRLRALHSNRRVQAKAQKTRYGETQ